MNFIEAGIFKKVGDVPSENSTSYKIDYNPQRYKNIRTLLNNQSYSPKLSKFTYQKTYYELVRFSQK
jgi:hypothetical protein